MQSFVNINHFKDDISDIDIFNAEIESVIKDKELLDKNGNPVRAAVLEVRAGDDTISVTLWGKWRGMANYLSAGDTVNIIKAKSRNFDESKDVNLLDTNALGYIVLEPSVMIDATKMAGVAIKHNHFCFMKYHQRKMMIEKVANYYVIKGNIVGNLFDEFLSDVEGFEFEPAFLRALDHEKLKFITIDYVPAVNNIRDEVKRDIDNLIAWHNKNDFDGYETMLEPDFISPVYGLQGRMDILLKKRDDNTDSIIVELKTGRSPEESGEAWIYHKYQVLAYNFIYESVYGTESKTSVILYSSSSDISREITFSNDFKRDFIFLRNKMIYYEKLYTKFDYEALQSFRRAKKECSSCPGYLQKKCDELFDTFESLTDEQRSYYFSLYRAVEHERMASSKKNSMLFDDDGSLKYKITGLSLKDCSSEESVLTLAFDRNESELREGDSVILHGGDPVHEPLHKGRIAKLSRGVVKVGLNNRFAKHFDRDREWTLSRHDYMMSARTMLDGLYKFAASSKRFKNLILLKTNPEFDNINIIKSTDNGFSLNAGQDAALNKSICARDYYLLQGPPGTGKTRSIAYIVNELVKRKQRVILSALTNRAVDNVLLRLIDDHGFDDFIRIGNTESTDTKLHDHLLSTQAKSYGIDEIKKLKKRVGECRLIATTTTSASLSIILDKLDFDVAIIDEASQIPEPSIFSAITRAKRFILVGDTHQLGPVTRSDYVIPEGDDRVAGIKSLQKTLFERLLEHNSNRYDLEEDNDTCGILNLQYRMNDEIVKFSNDNFYSGLLQSDESVVNGRIKLTAHEKMHVATEPEEPVVFIDVPGDSSGRENKKEAKIVHDIIESLQRSGIRGTDIGVISPFKAQCALIRKMIEPMNKGDILIDTVERFQGSERDVIITSFVVSDENGLEFLKESDTMNRKLNVTITRAKKKLILIGNENVLSGDPVYAALIASVKQALA